VKARKDVPSGAHRAISRLDRVLEGPRGPHVATSLEHAAERVVERPPVSRALPDLEIRKKEEERAAPVRPPPRVRDVEAAVTRARKALRQALEEALPQLVGGKEADARACDRLDVRGRPLHEPCVALRERGRREVDELVREHPVPGEVRRRRRESERDRDMRNEVVRAPGADPASPPRPHVEMRFGHGKPPEDGGDGAGRPFDPRDERGARNRRRVGADRDDDLASRSGDPDRFSPGRRGDPERTRRQHHHPNRRVCQDSPETK